MDLLLTVVTGVVSSITASVVFLFFLSRLKPSIEISPFVARDEDEKGKFFAFKIINKGSRPIIDIRADAALARNTNVAGGPIYWTEKIPLVKDFMFQIGPFDLNDQNADYALRFVTNTDLDELWSDERDFIRLRIITTDSLSGFSRARMKEYRLPRDCIQNGSHEWGPGLSVK